VARNAAIVAALAALAALLCGCGDVADRRVGQALFDHPFSYPIVDSSGRRVGSVSGTPGEKGITVHVAVQGLAPGKHGLHLHEAGRCDPPDFASAGAHWNGQGREHGHDNPEGAHDGDWGNLSVGADGHGATDRLIPRYHGKIPQDGLALVIHAGVDDERTDPSGNSGARIACGVVLPLVTEPVE
jgi:Cu-Zn family superoxide dismutase